MQDVIICSLYNFYPIFHCGLYCRAAYNAEQLSFHDSFFSSNLYTKTEQKTEKTTFLLHMYYIIVATAVCTAELFVLQETFLSFKLRGL